MKKRNKEALALEQSAQSTQSRSKLATETPKTALDKILKLGDPQIIGRLGTNHIFLTNLGHLTKNDLVEMGYSVSYLGKCMARIGRKKINVDVSCGAYRPPAQTVVDKPKDITSMMP